MDDMTKDGDVRGIKKEQKKNILNPFLLGYISIFAVIWCVHSYILYVYKYSKFLFPFYYIISNYTGCYLDRDKTIALYSIGNTYWRI